MADFMIQASPSLLYKSSPPSLLLKNTFTHTTYSISIKCLLWKLYVLLCRYRKYVCSQETLRSMCPVGKTWPVLWVNTAAPCGPHQALLWNVHWGLAAKETIRFSPNRTDLFHFSGKHVSEQEKDFTWRWHRMWKRIWSLVIRSSVE